MYMYVRFDFFFNDTPATEIYTLSLHDALPISIGRSAAKMRPICSAGNVSSSSIGIAATRSITRSRTRLAAVRAGVFGRSEEHTSELQSHSDLVCRLMLEKINAMTHVTELIYSQ